MTSFYRKLEKCKKLNYSQFRVVQFFTLLQFPIKLVIILYIFAFFLGKNAKMLMCIDGANIILNINKKILL